MEGRIKKKGERGKTGGEEGTCVQPSNFVKRKIYFNQILNLSSASTLDPKTKPVLTFNRFGVAVLNLE